MGAWTQKCVLRSCEADFGCWAISFHPLGLLPTSQVFRRPPLSGRLESLFTRAQFPRLLEHFAAMPLGKTEMGFIDITAKTLVFWTLLEGMIARLQVLVMKEELHFPTNATQLLLFIFHLGEKRGNLTVGFKNIYMCVF